MRYFLDTEFAEKPGTIKLISLALVADDGRELYCVSQDFDESDCNEWVRENVLPKLPPMIDRVPEWHIVADVQQFIGNDTPEFWGYYADYDWVVFCWLFGAMVDLPKGWPMYCRDLKQESDRLKAPKFTGPKGEHNALADARWNRDLYKYLTTQP